MTAHNVEEVKPRAMRAALAEWFKAHTAPVPTDVGLTELRKWRKKDQARRDAADVALWEIAGQCAHPYRGRK